MLGSSQSCDNGRLLQGDQPNRGPFHNDSLPTGPTQRRALARTAASSR